jgi:hypothetical protein
MQSASFSDLLRTSRLLRPADSSDEPRPLRGAFTLRSEDVVEGRINARVAFDRQRNGLLAAGLVRRLSGRWTDGGARTTAPSGFAADKRQRVIVTVFYQSHGAGAGKLLAHGRYLERDGVAVDSEKGRFYDRNEDKVDASPRLNEWAREDKRHMRLMLAPESGARFEEMKDFTRAVMAQMERDLGAPLDWVAVDHHNTDNPHVHVILRGRRRDGPDLIIPRAYASQGLRYAARDIATDMLGERGIEDERRALERESRAEHATRLDRMLQAEIKVGATNPIQAVGRNIEPNLRAALRNRVRQLARMGLVRETKRDRFRFEPNWYARLEKISRGVDIRRRLGRERAPGEGRLQLYASSMGRIAGEVEEIGQRGANVAKAFLVIRVASRGPVFVNVNGRAVEGLEPGALVSVEPRVHEGGGTRVRVRSLCALPLREQIGARAETELDREIGRALAGREARLPETEAIRLALAARMAWHERHGSGQRDHAGRFGFAPEALRRLRAEEWDRAATAWKRETRKRGIEVDDGLERDWTVRGIRNLHQGRAALLERADAVAIMPLTHRQQLQIGQVYSITMAQGKVQAMPALERER